MERARERLVLQRQHHLQDAEHAGRRLGVSDVGLQGAERHGRDPLGVAAEHLGQRARLDRVPEAGPGAVGVDRVDVGRVDARVGQGRPDHASLRRAVGDGESGAGAVLVDRGPADHREHPVPVRLCGGRGA